MDQETESQNGKIAPMFVYLVNDRAETNLSVLTSSPVLFSLPLDTSYTLVY